jgi:hypothetical protein
MREFLRPFTKPDSYAALREGYRYPICSLYLDSHDLALLEVKRKLNNVVHKRRAGINREAVRALLNRGRLDLDGLGPQDRRNAEYFYSHVALTEARPLIRVKYMREPYAAHGNEPVRITIDTDLMHAVTLDNSLSHVRGRWTTTPVDGVIVEVKFTERFPWWVQDFVQTFGLHQRAVPKYVWSVDHMMMDRTAGSRTTRSSRSCSRCCCPSCWAS